MPSFPVGDTYMLQMYMSLACNIVYDIPDILLPAAADEVLLRSSMLRKQVKRNKTVRLKENFIIVQPKLYFVNLNVVKFHKIISLIS